jgi:hypothetical protein
MLGCIVPLSLSVDGEQFIRDYKHICRTYPNHFDTYTGINLKKPRRISDEEGLTYGCGSLSDYPGLKESDYDTPTNQLKHTYVSNIIQAIEDYTSVYHGAKIGRARIMVLRGKSCLTWHVDKEDANRFHIPIITNDGCMFVHETPTGRVVSQMSDVGRLYSFNSSIPHTAVNASREDRVHLVLSGYYEDK